MTDDDYYTIRSHEALTGRKGRPSALRAAVLFAGAAIALSVLAVPWVGDDGDRRTARALGLGLDPVMTGSIDRSQPLGGRARRAPGYNDGTYVVRRSVLSGNSVCIIRSDGRKEGRC